MRLLVLGGTSWLGGAVASHALDQGIEVTCLARGSSGTVPQGATLVPADRWQPGAYDGLTSFDAAVEVSWQPTLVRSALEAVRADHWVYVSSISVYDDDATAAVPHGTMGKLLPAWQGQAEATPEVYGSAKVACEEAYAATLGASSFAIARAGLIAGYGDRSDRLGYWPARIASAVGERRRVLVPTDLESPVQVIDVEDLAAWLVHCAVHRVTGTYDAVGPSSTIGAVLDASEHVAGTSPSYVAVEDAVLERHGVRPWMGPESLPLWVGGARSRDFMQQSSTAAQEQGLALRPALETVGAALEWERSLGLDRPRTSGLSPELEARIISSI